MGRKDALFDTVLESVGNDGPFQHRFNYLYNVVFALLAAMPCLNIVLAMSIPDHWCHVPGRELTNYTVEEWKEITLPKTINNKGQTSTSSCDMYNITDGFYLQSDYNYTTIKCQFGYEYDNTWYDSTVTSQEDWVCDNEMRVTNTFVFGRLGDMLGALVFGQLSDIIGRKPIFFISLLLILVGKAMNLFLTKWYYWYVVGHIIASSTHMSLYQAVLIIGSEISTSEENSHIAMLQGIGWTSGISIMALVMWWLRDWYTFTLATSLPFALFLISNKYMIESPRWLASKGKMKRCEETLRVVAKENGATLNDDALELLKEDCSEPEKVYGMMSLFTSWRLAKNTLMLVICWMVGSLSYFLLILNINNMDGNPFLNYLYQGLAEIPAYVIGKWATNTIGRRWTAISSFSLAIMASLPLLYTSLDSSLHIITSILATIIKFCVSVCFCVMMVQGVEIYPTSLRQTGVAIGVITGNAFSVLGPYVAYLGITHDVRYPYVILCLMMLCGLVAEFLLPETLYQKLPETLAEAQVFGGDQTFWSFPKRRKFDPEDSSHEMKDNMTNNRKKI